MHERKIRVGSDYQAGLPKLQKKPAPGCQPSADEASWLQDFVMDAGRFGAADKPVPVFCIPHPDICKRYQLKPLLPLLCSIAFLTKFSTCFVR